MGQFLPLPAIYLGPLAKSWHPGQKGVVSGGGDGLAPRGGPRAWGLRRRAAPPLPPPASMLLLQAGACSDSALVPNSPQAGARGLESRKKPPRFPWGPHAGPSMQAPQGEHGPCSKLAAADLKKKLL